MPYENPVNTSHQRIKKRILGPQVPFEGDNGLYTQSWFPICMSSEIETGAVKGYPFLGGKVIVFRGGDGIARVTTAYCAHLGSDLSLGCVKDNGVQCPYHFWEFDGGTGACIKTGVGDVPPRNAGIYSFPVCEKHGLIWAFNGDEPLFDIPDWPMPESDLVVDTQPFPVHMPIDPWIICAQTPDIQHVILLHKFELIGPNPASDVEWTDYTMFYDLHGIAQGREMNIRAGLVGSSIFFQTGTLDGRWFGFLTAMGLPAPSTTSLFSVFAAEKASGDEDDVRAFIEDARNHEIAIASEDADIAASIKFKVGALTKADATLGKFFEKMRKFPRANPAADFLS
ncbi:aromatic ring-hydroxylating oxygenase subunit alpha [Kordiimonas pumila]|uniref:Aromatic ring-hydroxylating dioxygenase subunit alpha n=1 Tax=Kordiimonas pumila TaxID=2161677 RepID=A0ABV7D5E4_9PROT|nr:Rieske (2Fe-2S) protein [Kordiimonas pumila]